MFAVFCASTYLLILFVFMAVIPRIPNSLTVFTAQCHASVVYAVFMCLSVCLSQGSVLLKWLNVGSRKQQHIIAQGL